MVNNEKLESNFNENPIQYLKTFLSINTHVGCNLDCAYCILHAFNLPFIPKPIATPKEVLELLLKNIYFIKNQTPIVINNKTDPLLPEVKDSTFQLLKLISEHKFKNPVVLISKLKYTEEEIDMLEKLNLNIYHFTSYSGLEYPIEKVNKSIQEENIKLLVGSSIRSIHYWRPIIQGINDKPKIMEKILSFVVDRCSASVFSGIRLPKIIIEKLKRLGLIFEYDEHYAIHKKLSNETKKILIEIAHSKYPNYPIFFHTSCVMSYFEKYPDYNLSYLKEFHCNPFCKNKKLCTEYFPPLNLIKREISKFTDTYKIIKEEKTILVPDTLSLEDLSYLRFALKLKVIRETEGIINK